MNATGTPITAPPNNMTPDTLVDPDLGVYVPPAVVILESAILLLISTVAFTANASLWLVVLTTRDLRTESNVLILCLSLADLLVAIIGAPFTLSAILSSRWIFSRGVCTFVGYLNMLTFVTSVQSLGAISINRYYKICRPGKYLDIYTFRNVGLIFSGVWVYSGILAIPPLVGWASYDFIPTASICFCNWSMTASYAVFMIVMCFCVPCFLMILCYVAIIKAFLQSRKNVQSFARSVKKSKPTSSGVVPSSQYSSNASVSVVGGNNKGQRGDVTSAVTRYGRERSNVTNAVVVLEDKRHRTSGAAAEGSVAERQTRPINELESIAEIGDSRRQKGESCSYSSPIQEVTEDDSSDNDDVELTNNDIPLVKYTNNKEHPLLETIKLKPPPNDHRFQKSRSHRLPRTNPNVVRPRPKSDGYEWCTFEPQDANPRAGDWTLVLGHDDSSPSFQLHDRSTLQLLNLTTDQQLNTPCSSDTDKPLTEALFDNNNSIEVASKSLVSSIGVNGQIAPESEPPMKHDDPSAFEDKGDQETDYESSCRPSLTKTQSRQNETRISRVSVLCHDVSRNNQRESMTSVDVNRTPLANSLFNETAKDFTEIKDHFVSNAFDTENDTVSHSSEDALSDCQLTGNDTDSKHQSNNNITSSQKKHNGLTSETISKGSSTSSEDSPPNVPMIKLDYSSQLHDKVQNGPTPIAKDLKFPNDSDKKPELGHIEDDVSSNSKTNNNNDNEFVSHKVKSSADKLPNSLFIPSTSLQHTSNNSLHPYYSRTPSSATTSLASTDDLSNSDRHINAPEPFTLSTRTSRYFGNPGSKSIDPLRLSKSEEHILLVTPENQRKTAAGVSFDSRLDTHRLSKRSKSLSMSSPCILNTPTKPRPKKQHRAIHSAKRSREEFQLAGSLLVVILIFIICWFPYCISMFVSFTTPDKSSHALDMTALLLGYTNSCVNPIVYGLMNRRFKNGYRRLYARCLNWLRVSKTSNFKIAPLKTVSQSMSSMA